MNSDNQPLHISGIYGTPSVFVLRVLLGFPLAENLLTLLMAGHMGRYSGHEIEGSM